MIVGTENNAAAFEINGSLFDPGKVLPARREAVVEEARVELEETLGRILDQEATVIFDFEEE